MRELSITLLLAAVVPSTGMATTIDPGPGLWTSAVPGTPGPAAPGWPRTSITVHDAHGDTEYRWGIIPTGLANAGAFLDATAWRTNARAVRSNGQAHAATVHGEGGTAVPELPVRARIAPSEWLRGYVTPIHCTLIGGETYLNVQFTVMLYSDHAVRSCAPEQVWIERALQLLWYRADSFAHGQQP
jgi:hypothetical protein